MNYINKKKNGGFTLIELLVAIAIIGVLSGVVLQSLKTARQRSWNATRLSDIDQINKALELYLTKAGGAGSFPSSGGGWDCIQLLSGTCWGGVVSAPSPAGNPATDINAALVGNIAKIPKDPVITTGSYGDYYAYSSSWTWTALPLPSPALPTGAYLAWVVNDIGSLPCGRGVVYTPWTSSPGFKECVLYLGK